MARRPTKTDALAVIREHGPAISAVLDVGVQYGTPELAETFPDIPHYLFEPVPEYRDQIEAAYSDIPHERIEAAVSREPGAFTLFTRSFKNDGAISHSRLEHDRGDAAREGEAARTVPTITLDSFVGERDLAGPLLLKIDTDGNEMNVLAGASETLKRCACVVIEATLQKISERLIALETAGFRLYDICDLLYYDGALHQCDLVFVDRGIWRNSALHRRRAGPIDPAKFQKLA